MFHQALRKHEVSSVLSQKTQPSTGHQQSLSESVKRAAAPPANGARPLSHASGNIIKHNAFVKQQPPKLSHGIKRTSSGLAKAVSQDDSFEYPELSISDDNEWPITSLGAPDLNKPPNAPAVFFDENDFDSDLDLDVEDPATKGTVEYPTLPKVDAGVASTAASKTASERIARGVSRDSGYHSVPTSLHAGTLNGSPQTPVADSTQEIPWSSSPAEHFQTPLKSQFFKAAPAAASRKAEPLQTKRRTLPWLQNASQNQPENKPEPEESQAKKSRTSKGINAYAYTPSPKDSTKSTYPWNTTASAVKQQQKNLREAHKLSKAHDGTEDDVKKAVAKKKRNTVHRIFLSEEQQHVLNLVIEHKKSVFFTGSAGTGKSVLLREIIAGLRKKFIREPDRVAVTASTGLSACNIGGVTLHSFAGIGLGKESAEDLVKKIRKNAKAKQRWLRTKVLIVDEISMVDGELFDKLEQIARTLRNNGRPFGGIQLIITGDFFQLPPVPESGRVAKFAFDAGTWTTAVEHTIGLHHVFRQKDPVFANMLNEMREGRMSAASIAAFKKLDRPLPASEDDIEATELFPTRQEVDRANSVRMQQLHGNAFSYDARDGGTITDLAWRNKLLQNCIAPETVHLKKGAQVMLIKNMDDTLVNGSLGRVTSFMTDHMFALYKENEDAFFENGRNGPMELDAKAAQKASILGVNTQQVYPVVRFTIADGTTRDLHIKRESWKVELPNGEVQASREQIPLILAWALSIHKAQGQTLERVRVDLGKVFEKGQAYVALSRATSMQGLQVLRFDAKKVNAHEKVRHFYSSLSKAEQAGAQLKAAKKSVFGSMKAKAYEENFVGEQ